MIVCASTLAGYVMDNEVTWGAWLQNALQMEATWPDGIRWFAALEIDSRGAEPFAPLIDVMDRLHGVYWTFSLDDGRTRIESGNRVEHICLGWNIAAQYAENAHATHLLTLGADTMPPPDVLPKLTAMNYPIVGGEVPTYCLTGPVVKHHPLTGEPFRYDVQQHMATTSLTLIRRDLLKRVRFRTDVDEGLTDDPSLHHDASALGFPTLVRKDCIGRHYPTNVNPIEERGHADMTVYR